jgi:hypothetical protein
MLSRFSALTLLALMGSAGVARAHHNMSASFDFNDRLALTGTLKSIDWRNPHIYLVVEVLNGTEAVNWTIEGPPPGFFRTRDVGKSDFESAIGKQVKWEASRARDGSHSGLLRLIDLPNGKTVSACPQNC